MSLSVLGAAGADDDLKVRVKTGVLIGSRGPAFEPSRTFRSPHHRSATGVGRLLSLHCPGIANEPPTHSVLHVLVQQARD